MLPGKSKDEPAMTLTDAPVTVKEGEIAVSRLRPQDDNILTLLSPNKSSTDQSVSGPATEQIKVDAQTVFTIPATRPYHTKLYKGSILVLLAMTTAAIPALYYLYDSSLLENMVMPAAVLLVESPGITEAATDISDSHKVEPVNAPPATGNFAITSSRPENATIGKEDLASNFQHISGDDKWTEVEPDVSVPENIPVVLLTETEVQIEPSTTATMPSHEDEEAATKLQITGHDTPADMNEIHIIRTKSKNLTAELVNSAYIAYLAGRYSDALQGYHKALMEMPDNRDALLGVAAIAQRTGDPETAWQSYLKISAKFPDDPAATAGLMNLMEGRNYQGSIQAIRKFLRVHPHTAYLHFLLGTLHAHANHWLEAQEAFAEACRLENDNPDYAYNLAVSLDHSGEGRNAHHYYNTALELAQGKAVNFDISAVMVRIISLSTSAPGP